EEAMGFVWEFETHSAVILYDRVHHLAVSKRIEVASILGIAMAHEIGHLMLRSREHSSEGIMRPYWSSTNLQSAAQSGYSACRDSGEVGLDGGAARKGWCGPSRHAQFLGSGEAGMVG